MSNLEIEYKYKVKNLASIGSKLTALGAEKTRLIHGVDIYFIVPSNPEGRKYLRLRDQNGQAELSFSYVQSEAHTMEWETAIGDIKIADELLAQLGYKHDVTVDKVRTAYSYRNSEVVLDRVKDLGSFVEVESPTLMELKSIAKELGLSEDDRIQGLRGGYPDLLRGHLISD